MNTKKLLFVALMMMCAITVHALQLREGHFFKTFSDVQPMVKAAPALFDQWFALPEDTEWREVSRQTDNIGMERIEYRQYVGGVEVEYSQVLLHVRDGRVQSANGTVMEQQRTPAKLQRNSVMSRGGTPTDLLGRKLLLIDTDEDSYVSLNLHYSQGTEETTTVGKLWSGKMDKTDAPLDFLKLNKIVIAPTEGATLIISLFKNVKDEETQMQDLEETFLGVVPLTFSPDSTALDIQGEHMKIHLEYEANTSTPLADIHWGMGRTVDFYKEMFGLDSYDNNHAPIYNLVYLDDGLNGLVYSPLDNAMAMGECKPYPMVYGMGADIMNPCVELTVMAHEYTHIITGQTAKLEYKSESGALNESFSDIMGISVKKWNDPSYKQWTCGSGGLMVNYTNLRDMKNPRNSMDGKEESRRCPGYYHGYNWFDTTDTSDENDNGGVHRNCGVQNRWYFLLCEGETSDNSNFVEGGKPYSMTGIGMEKALQIAYRTLTQYATSQSQYADIRLCHLQAAKDLYGDNSSEVQAVAKA